MRAAVMFDRGRRQVDVVAKLAMIISPGPDALGAYASDGEIISPATTSLLSRKAITAYQSAA